MPSVRLSRPSAEDFDEYSEVVRASHDLHRPWVFPEPDRVFYDRYLARCETDAFEGFFARDVPTGKIIGVFNLSQIFRGGFQNAFLGFWANVAFSGQGRMRESLEVVVRHAFSELGLHRLEANIQPENERSKALVARVGFRKEGYSPRYLQLGGEWRDHERWAITAEDVG